MGTDVPGTGVPRFEQQGGVAQACGLHGLRAAPSESCPYSAALQRSGCTRGGCQFPEQESRTVMTTRRMLTAGAALAVTVALTVAVAAQGFGNPHFTYATLNADNSVDFQIAGLGNALVGKTITFTLESTYAFDFECVNPGGKVPGSSKFHGSVSNNRAVLKTRGGREGQITDTIGPVPGPETLGVSDVCPPADPQGNWTLNLSNVVVEDATLTASEPVTGLWVTVGVPYP